MRVASANAALELDGSTAAVIAETENIVSDEGNIIWYYLTQVVRNPSGEYFLLKTTDKSPFVRHLSQSRAKLVLKDKYVPPSRAKSDA